MSSRLPRGRCEHRYIRAGPTVLPIDVPDGLLKELREVEPVSLPDRDVRAGKPLILSSVLRFDTLRGLARVVDARRRSTCRPAPGHLHGARGEGGARAPEQLDQMWGQANEYFPLAALVMLLLFARSGLYRDRAQRPGFSRVIASLFQVTLVVLIYAAIEGEPFQSYYIFYASLFFALLYVSLLRWGFERVSGVAAARRGLPPPRGAGRLGAEHPGRVARAARLERDRALRLRGPHPGRAARRAARLPLARAARAPLRRRSTRC